jgi:hypothetical protein
MNTSKDIITIYQILFYTLAYPFSFPVRYYVNVPDLQSRFQTKLDAFGQLRKPHSAHVKLEKIRSGHQRIIPIKNCYDHFL